MSKKQLFIKWETNDGLTMISKYILPESISKDLDGKQGEKPKSCCVAYLFRLQFLSG